VLARAGHSVLLLEQHYRLGGMATWFRRPRGNIFDISLHGFPVGMIKSCRKYWNEDIASHIRQIKAIHFNNPQFSFYSRYDQADFLDKLVNHFGIERSVVDDFFATIQAMRVDKQDSAETTTRELFQQFFPDRPDVWRLLMEPIAYANGSSLDDPAITFAIVYANFMSKGVFIYEGGSDDLEVRMKEQLRRSGVDIRIKSLVEKILIDGGSACGVIVNGRKVESSIVISNAGLKNTILNLVGAERLPAEYAQQARKVRLNNSSCQVYMGLKRGESMEFLGDLFFTSTCPVFDSVRLCAKDITSRTYSLYYPDIRPGTDRYAIVSSTNANYEDWAYQSAEDYRAAKHDLIESTLDALDRYVTGIRSKIDWVEASTPCTFEHYTLQMEAASFGTKYEGLKVSMDLPANIRGLFHAGSVGLIMSGWLGTINYGVIVANKVEALLARQEELCERAV
jgi:phytoene dehydrogenase-like protein